MVGKKKKAAKRAKAETSTATKPPRRGANKQDRRAHKLEKRKQEKKNMTAEMWAAPAPTHLVAKLDLPKVQSKYQSYFEFADNPEKKQKKLEFQVGLLAIVDALRLIVPRQVTNQPLDKYPGYAFVPVGDPILTNACKELSREQGAMIFIVSVCSLPIMLSSSLTKKFSRTRKKKTTPRYRNMSTERATIFENPSSTKLGK